MKKGEKTNNHLHNNNTKCAKFFIFYTFFIWIFIIYLYCIPFESEAIEEYIPENIKELLMDKLEGENDERLFIIGDIHGCSVEFRELLEKLNFRTGIDKVVLVGDLIGKGPYSREVIQIAMEINAQCVRGNHDDLLIRYYQHTVLGMKEIEKPSLKTSYKEIAQSLNKEEWDYLLSLPLYIELPKYNLIIVHAGIVPGIELSKQDPDVMMNIRNIDEAFQPNKEQGGDPWINFWDGPQLIVFGHDAVRGLQVRNANITNELLAVGIDSGACYGGHLSAFVLPDRKIVQVKAHKVYEIPKLKLNQIVPNL